MPFPPGIQTVVLTGRQTLADGTADRDPVVLTPVPSRIVSAEHGVIVDDEPISVIPDAAGDWSMTLLATDATGCSPTGWTYRVEAGADDPWYISLPASLVEVDLAVLTPAATDPGEYVLVPGPPGAKGDPGDVGPQPPLGAAGAGADIALRSTDASTTNARTPTSHAASHAAAGGDPVTLTQAQITGLAAALAALLPLAGGTLTGATTVNVAGSTATAIGGGVTGDTFDRWRVTADGKMALGPGNAVRDTFWYRDGVNSARTDGAWTVGGDLKHIGTKMGFGGATAITRPAVTGAKGGNTALASLIGALVALGLITDSTTA